MKEIIIGKEGSQPFPITSDSVSRQHARLTVRDDGSMILEDLNSKNGTYLRNAEGDFERISRAVVKDDDVIRLGYAGIHSRTLWVHHLLVDDPMDYSYEFHRLRQIYQNDIKARQEELMRKGDSRDWFTIGAPVAGLCLSFLFKNDPLMIRLAITVPSLTVGLFFAGFAKKMRALVILRQSIITCPHCGRPLSDYDLEQQQCTMCKAHS